MFIRILDTVDELSIRLLLRITARVSLGFFLCAFSGGALHRLWPAALTRWLADIRRHVTLGLAASHTLHLVAILALAITMGSERFLHEVRWAGLIGGGIGFLFIYGLAIDALLCGRISWLASSRFQALAHYLIWAIFAVALVPRALSSMLYFPFALAVLTALALRLMAAVRSRENVALIAAR